MFSAIKLCYGYIILADWIMSVEKNLTDNSTKYWCLSFAS